MELEKQTTLQSRHCNVGTILVAPVYTPLIIQITRHIVMLTLLINRSQGCFQGGTEEGYGETKTFMQN